MAEAEVDGVDTEVKEVQVGGYRDRMNRIWNAIEDNGCLVISHKTLIGTGDWDGFYEALKNDDMTTGEIRKKIEETTYEVTVKFVFVGEGDGLMARQIIGDATIESADRKEAT